MTPAPAARPRRFTALLAPGCRTFFLPLFTAAALFFSLGFPAAEVRAQAAPAPAPGTATAAPSVSPVIPAAPAPGKANCDVILSAVGPNKISVIKQVRDAVPGLGLAEAKMLVESAPKLIRSGVTRAEADATRQKLEAAGATVTIEADGTKVATEPAAPTAVAPGVGPGKCDVILTEVGPNKIAVIKQVRDAVPGMGLVMAKTLVESAPKPVKEGITRQEAAAIKRRIEAAGATVTIREGR